MSYCEDCGTRLSGYVCPNCQEELLITLEQAEFLPDRLSEEFEQLVAEQKEQVAAMRKELGQ